MARGVQTSPPLSSLPKVEFQKIDDDVSTQPCGVHDVQARAFGYNDFSEFSRPDSYIRHIEPLESELAKQVEYDMDEQDKEWLDSLNRERKKEQMTPITYELFEVVMDRLEKEWFDLTKNIPKPDLALPSEDSTCAICDDSEGENSNAIVFCDGCNLAVHQDCYGVPYIPEGQWLCRKCTVSPENPVSCILCPNEGGAFKQTVHGEWVHLLCAIWVPETRVANDVFMEPIIGVDKISKQRWKLKCNICDIREGACIQCAKTSCFLAFHATCARGERLLLPMKSAQGAEPVTLTAYCERHLPKDQLDARATALAADEALEDDSPGHTAKLAKSARAYAKTYKPGPPLVPAIVVTRIDYYIRRFKLSKRIPSIQMMCRYWSLKREARRGAPLLKRLHLEPWTASAGGKAQTEEEKVMKLEQLNRLLYDMERLKELTLAVKKRERWKLEQARAIYDVLENSLFVHEQRLRAAFEKIMTYDRQDYFKYPVSKVDVPDYFDIITNPMCWAVIEDKLDKHEYWDLHAFKADIDLVVDNAMLYNKPGTPFHKAALRIQTATTPVLQDLSHQLPAPTPTSHESQESSIGDLEPPLELLELLLSPEAIQDEIDLELTDTPIASLLSFELPKMKPPPPPPPPKPPKVKRDRKAERKAEYQKRKQEKEAAAAKAREEAAAQAEVEAAEMAARAVEEEAEAEAAAEAEVVAEAEAEAEAEKVAEAAAAATAAIETPVEAEAVVEPAPAPKPRGRRPKAVKSGQAIAETQTKVSLPTALPLDVPMEDAQLPAVDDMVPDSALPSSAMTGPTQSRRGGRRGARQSSAGRSHILNLVENVDSQESFKRFDIGWILPAEQRRGGRAPVDRRESVSVAPRAKKRMRMDPDPGPSEAGPSGLSRLSVVSTTVSDNQTLDESTPAKPDTPLPDEPMEVDEPLPVEEDMISYAPLSVTRSRRAGPSQGPSMREMPLPPPPRQVVHLPNGKVVIEELDTPAIRRAKAKKAKEQRQLAQLQTAAVGSEEPGTSMSVESTIPTMSPASAVSAAPVMLPASAVSEASTVPAVPEASEVSPGPAMSAASALSPVPSGPAASEASPIPPASAALGASSKPVSSLRSEVSPLPAASMASPVPPESAAPTLSTVPAVSAVSAVSAMSVASSAPAMSAPVPGPSRRGRKRKIANTRVLKDKDAKGRYGRGKNREKEEDKNEDKDQHEGESELSSLSESESEGAASGSAVPRSTSVTPGNDGAKEAGRVVLDEGRPLEGGTLVWAKLNRWPWWPAVVYEDNDINLPVNIKATYKQRIAKVKEALYIVQFFDQNKSWQYLGLNRLLMLGEDDELDKDMLAVNSTRQKWRTAKMRESCSSFYRQAMDEMETGSDIARNEAAIAEYQQLLEAQAATAQAAEAQATEAQAVEDQAAGE